ncbi:VOC family protein [Acidipila sp. EB88]|uniref:VOC family protein n=1 Tax=Acidipila sp. EB88 TaxID=2305226 RepID=UPI000F5EEEED|nr:VOC family protein [Acidipila sp. EB88]RRA47582.1 VOC family protein [Acidipila sp. EB88]
MKMRRREVLGVLAASAGAALLPTSPLGAESVSIANTLPKEKVTGIGGLFFRAQDPKSLAQWYQDHLGVFVTPQKSDEPVWNQQAGPTSFTPFPEKTKYISDPTKQWMINFRVSDLDKMVAQLESAGITVKLDPTAYPYGRFAHTHDPEGNAIELWQPGTSTKPA